MAAEPDPGQQYAHLDDGQVATLAAVALAESYTVHGMAELTAYQRYEGYMHELSRRRIRRVLAEIAGQHTEAPAN